MNRIACLAILVMTLVLTAAAFAQEGSGMPLTVEGTVKDASGATLSGFWLVFTPHEAERTVSRVGTRTHVGDAGRFRVELPPAVYHVTTAPPFCGVEPVLWTAASSGVGDILLKPPDSADVGVAAQPGIVGNTLDTALPKEVTLRIAATPFGPVPYGVDLKWERPNFRETYPGGHLVRTELCDPRLLTRRPEPGVPTRTTKDER